jgi:hypothetical protein
MKTIVENSTNLSKFIYEDDVVITMEADRIVIGDPEFLIVGCHNENDSTVYENVTNVPVDWTGNKFTFDGTTWTLNPNWVDPDAEEA